MDENTDPCRKKFCPPRPRPQADGTRPAIVAGDPRRFVAPLALKSLSTSLPATKIVIGPRPGGARRPKPVAAAPPAPAASAAPTTTKLVYRVFYCKRSNRKVKSHAEGVLVRVGSRFSLFSEDGKQLCSATQNNICRLGQGSEMECGTYDVEVDATIDIDEYQSGRCFIARTVPSNDNTPTRAPNVVRKIEIAKKNGGNVVPRKPTEGDDVDMPDADRKAPAKISSRNDPNALNALILYTPPTGSNDRYVVLCPFISNFLRPHQRAGVKFIYDCLTGVSTPGHYGCILADEMGLGKTLQTIAVMWSLLKDGPAGPVISRAIVVVPSSLVDNWANEIRKWLGNHRLEVLAMQSSANAKQQRIMIDDFVSGARWPVLIISYEMCRKFSSALSVLANRRKGIMLICDEGHRLKNAQGNRTIAALEELGATRRLLITGTPIQNQLDELYAMCSFVNPGLLSTLESFRHAFIRPIQAWRDGGVACSADDQAIGEARAAELQSLTSSFILRRTNDILSKYLPPKIESVLFCRMSPLQLDLYRTFVASHTVKRLIASGSTAAALSSIVTLRKLVNDPALIYNGEDVDGLPFPDDYDPLVKSDACKMVVVDAILDAMHAQSPPGKTVIVSNFVQTLEVIERMCAAKGIKSFRLDGQTSAQARQPLVTQFNDASRPETVFLLSAKAGGCGLNLIGACRLVLFDNDWNPATDEQAMARIWRDGQRFPCVIYRLLTVGGIDEKIFQRQLTKQELALVIDNKDQNVQRMSRDDLKQLFSLRCDEQYCQTMAMLEEKGADASTDPSTCWAMHRDPSEIPDPILHAARAHLPPGMISFAMTKTTNPDALPKAPPTT
ncbi:DNA repair and recombination protein RAD54B [Plasmodiophora brassicae]|uniref:DNA repair and recombination protein RAD54B n=1 Tax=Plasmodiophora brassicae TaxID=37360 RepID=A0A3P3Y7P1_PLABS|nr:unnamed protein product [Plasmodiophora brassicae]